MAVDKRLYADMDESGGPHENTGTGVAPIYGGTPENLF